MNVPRKRCILVVDDDAGIRHLLVTWLGRGGFRLLEARDGREALQAMRAGNTDLVIMDLMMPVMSGLEVLRVRAADPSLQSIPILMVTAGDGPGVIADILDLNVYAIVAKPFDLEVLLATVISCLENPTDYARAA